MRFLLKKLSLHQAIYKAYTSKWAKSEGCKKDVLYKLREKAKIDRMHLL